MICPVWQYPHCGTSSAIQACCSTCSPLAPRPSIVVTFLPTTCETGVEQERIALPSTWTVQAPHNPAPHPNLVPVSSRVSRRTQRRGVSGETLTLFSPPLTRSVMSAMDVQLWILRAAQHGNELAEKVEMSEGTSGGTNSFAAVSSALWAGPTSVVPISAWPV